MSQRDDDLGDLIAERERQRRNDRYRDEMEAGFVEDPDFDLPLLGPAESHADYAGPDDRGRLFPEADADPGEYRRSVA